MGMINKKCRTRGDKTVFFNAYDMPPQSFRHVLCVWNTLCMYFCSQLSLNCIGRTYLFSRILSRFSICFWFVVPFSLTALRSWINLENSRLVSCSSSFFRLSVAQIWTKMVQLMINSAKKRRLLLQGIVTCEYFMAHLEWSVYCFLYWDFSNLEKRSKYLRSITTKLFH